MRGKVQLSTLCLLIVGMSDLVVSLIWIHANGALGEGNPLFAWLARFGSVEFALGKLLFLAGPVLILEYARRFRPTSAEVGTWLATLLYIAFLGIHVRSMFVKH